MSGMMPELDRYAGTVLGAYGVALTLIAGLIIVSLWRAASVRRELARIEAQMGRGADGAR
jgi:heme exporter protein D